MQSTDRERYRAYLSVPGADEARLDPSGAVQQTLLEAHRAADGLAQ